MAGIMPSSAVVTTQTMPTLPGDGMVSIGVAIAIPAPWGRQVRDARREIGDPQADVIPPHITLLPPTQVPQRAMPRIRHHLVVAAGHYPPFTISLRGTGSFRPVSPVVFVNVVEGAEHCDRLQQLVNAGVLHRPLHFDYHPHVTLGHNVSDEKLDAVRDRMSGFRATFPVEHFGLYRFDGHGSWQVDTTVHLGSAPLNEEHRP